MNHRATWMGGRKTISGLASWPAQAMLRKSWRLTANLISETTTYAYVLRSMGGFGLADEIREREIMGDTTVDVTDDGAGEGSGFTPIASQADLDRLIGERVARERAKFSDYKDVKAKASRFDELEAEKLSEIEKANARAEQAERELGELKTAGERRALVDGVATAKGVPGALLTGTTKEELEASADALIAFRGEANSTKTPEPNPLQGRAGGHALNGDGLEQALRAKLGIK